MPPKKATSRSAGPPSVETRAARAAREAAEQEDERRRAAANATISPITASPPGSPPPRSPSTPPSTGRTPPSPIPSISSYSQPCGPPTPPSPLGHFGDYRGGPSDTPPFSVFCDVGPEDAYFSSHNFNLREYHDQSVSRQLYIYRTLTSIRNRFNWLTSILVLLPWRFGIYPYRMYLRPTNLMCLALLTGSICYISINWLWLSQLYTAERLALIHAVLQTYISLMWLLLHVFDLYRAIEYLMHNPQNIFPGYWTDTTIRVCAIVRPGARVIIAISVFLACLEENMTLAEWYSIPYKMFTSTFTLALLCGLVEIAIYWFVGFFARRRRMVYAMGGNEVGGLIERWEVEVVLPWSTVVAAFYAAWFFSIYVKIALERGWWFAAGGTAYRGAWSELMGFWVPSKRILPPRSIGDAW